MTWFNGEMINEGWELDMFKKLWKAKKKNFFLSVWVSSWPHSMLVNWFTHWNHLKIWKIIKNCWPISVLAEAKLWHCLFQTWDPNQWTFQSLITLVPFSCYTKNEVSWNEIAQENKLSFWSWHWSQLSKLFSQFNKHQKRIRHFYWNCLRQVETNINSNDNGADWSCLSWNSFRDARDTQMVSCEFILID